MRRVAACGFAPCDCRPLTACQEKSCGKTRPTTGARRREAGRRSWPSSAWDAARTWPPSTSAARSRTIQRTAERDPKFAEEASRGEVQRRARPGQEHPQRGEEGAVLAGGGLGAGTRLSRKIRPPRPRRDHRRADRPAAGAVRRDHRASRCPSEYRNDILKKMDALARSLGIDARSGRPTR